MSVRGNGYSHDVVDLDDVGAGPDADARSAQCGCGVRRTALRHHAVSPVAGRAMAKLKAAHPAEYARYFDDLKSKALAEFDMKRRQHLAGNHSSR